jgi:hypothetical protein
LRRAARLHWCAVARCLLQLLLLQAAPQAAVQNRLPGHRCLGGANVLAGQKQVRHGRLVMPSWPYCCFCFDPVGRVPQLRLCQARSPAE